MFCQGANLSHIPRLHHHSLMRMAENGVDKLDPYKVVCDMRRARNYLVQTLIQYQFVFKTILEALSKRHAKAKKVRCWTSDESSGCGL